MSTTDDTVWLVRHGQSAANAGLATEHPRTIPLTPLGLAQAADIASQIPRPPDWIAISPFLRTAETAAPSLARFPQTAVLTWPIEELTYLSPARCRGTRQVDRHEWAMHYWAKADPDFLDGEDAESFTTFMHRVQNLAALLDQTPGFGIIFGHGMFLKAFLIGWENGFDASAESMRSFRALETAQPLANGQIIEFKRRSGRNRPC